MENKQKFWLPRLLRSSLTSCRPRNLTDDVVENSTFTPQTTSFRSLEPSLFRKSGTSRRHRVSEEHSETFKVSAERHTFCPPASPAFPVNPYYDHNRSFRANDKDLKKTKTKTKKKRRSYRRRSSKKRSPAGSDLLFSSSSFDGSWSLSSRFKSSGSWCWSSSDEDDDNNDEEQEEEEEEEAKEEKHDDKDVTDDAFFSSRRFSSSSSTAGVVPPVKEGFAAVVKKSVDPYEDFRVSMLEMIFERQIFAAAELEQLLQCFLVLNSRHHHRIIVEVFLEIYEALFST